MDTVVNNITIIGNLTQLEKSHNHGAEEFYTGIVETKRESGVVDYVPVLISGYLEPKEGRVKIDGQVRSRSYQEKGKNHLEVFAFAVGCEDTAEVKDESNVIVEGYICSKKELRKTPGGRVITDFILAVNHQIYKKSYYLPVVAWGRFAYLIDQFDIGDRIRVIGRFQSRSYVKNINGKQVDRWAFELSAMMVEKI